MDYRLQKSVIFVSHLDKLRFSNHFSEMSTYPTYFLEVWQFARLPLEIYQAPKKEISSSSNIVSGFVAVEV